MTSAALRSRSDRYPLSVRTERYRNYLFPYCVLQWNSMDRSIRNLPTITPFKHTILFSQPRLASIFKQTSITLYSTTGWF